MYTIYYAQHLYIVKFRIQIFEINLQYINKKHLYIIPM